ncbi:MAG TPA: hypothetical protein VLT57_02865, partial [Bryobacteraceae bacterium]|nr:hypothetical protein [Bryobacteraceae bacterium]
ASRKELELASALIRQLAAPFRPDQFHDTYRENVEALIEQKRKGEKITAVARPKRAPVIDLMEALKKSLRSPGAKGQAKKAGAPKRTAKSGKRRKAA